MKSKCIAFPPIQAQESGLSIKYVENQINIIHICK